MSQATKEPNPMADGKHTAGMAGELPNIFYEPASRGRLCEIKVRAHATGTGETIARYVELEHAKLIVHAVECHDDLLAALKGLLAPRGTGLTNSGQRYLLDNDASRAAVDVAQDAIARATGDGQ